MGITCFVSVRSVFLRFPNPRPEPGDAAPADQGDLPPAVPPARRGLCESRSRYPAGLAQLAPLGTPLC